MHNVIITAEQAKTARTVLGLSQGKMAGLIGLNRSYLSQFENGRYLLDDDSLYLLREYYEKQGYVFGIEQSTVTQSVSPKDEASASSPLVGDDLSSRMLGAARVMDGFVVPDDADPDEIEVILLNFTDNERKINQLLNSPVKRGWLGGIDEDDQDMRELDVLKLMARNYLLVKELHGHELLPVTPKEKIETIGDGINEIFADV